MSEPVAAPVPTCEVSAEALPPNFRKQVDPASPLPLRMMSARGLVPMPPADQVTALYILSFDPDDKVREATVTTASGMPDKILGAVLRGDLPGPVLGFMARCLADKPQYLELILLNGATTDATFADLAHSVGERLVTIIAENQLRMLREPDIIRALHQNPNVSKGILDKIVDFAVRSGVNLPDLPSFQEARRRLLGDKADLQPDVEETAEGLIEANREALGEEHEDGKEVEEDVRMTLTQKVLRMTVSEKIKLATLGNKEARTLLLRDSNRLVQAATIQSPRITEGEVITLANSKTLPDEVLRLILNNRDFMKSYQIKVNLVNNPKTPLPTALRLLPHLRGNDLRALARSRNVPNALSVQARRMLDRKTSG